MLRLPDLRLGFGSPLGAGSRVMSDRDHHEVMNTRALLFYVQTGYPSERRELLGKFTINAPFSCSSFLIHLHDSLLRPDVNQTRHLRHRRHRCVKRVDLLIPNISCCRCWRNRVKRSVSPSLSIGQRSGESKRNVVAEAVTRIVIECLESRRPDMVALVGN